MAVQALKGNIPRGKLSSSDEDDDDNFHCKDNLDDCGDIRDNLR